MAYMFGNQKHKTHTILTLNMSHTICLPRYAHTFMGDSITDGNQTDRHTYTKTLINIDQRHPKQKHLKIISTWHGVNQLGPKISPFG